MSSSGSTTRQFSEFRARASARPRFVKADYNLALAYAHMKRTDDAMAILKRLLAADPQNTQLLSALGVGLPPRGATMRMPSRSTTPCLALSPADLNALYNSGIILWKLNRPPRRLDRFTALLDKSPDDLDALYAAGSLLLSLDDAAAPADMLSRYLEKKPGDTEALVSCGGGAPSGRRSMHAPWRRTTRSSPQTPRRETRGSERRGCC